MYKPKLWYTTAMKNETLRYISSTAAFATSVGLAVACYEAANKSMDIYNQGIKNGEEAFEKSIGIKGMQSAGLIKESINESGQTVYVYNPYHIPGVIEDTYVDGILLESPTYEEQGTSADLSTSVDQEHIKNTIQERIITEYPIPTLPQTSGFNVLGSEDKTYMAAHHAYNDAYRNHVDTPTKYLVLDANMKELDQITDVTFVGALGLLATGALTFPPKKQEKSQTI